MARRATSTEIPDVNGARVNCLSIVKLAAKDRQAARPPLWSRLSAPKNVRSPLKDCAMLDKRRLADIPDEIQL